MKPPKGSNVQGVELLESLICTSVDKASDNYDYAWRDDLHNIIEQQIEKNSAAKVGEPNSADAMNYSLLEAEHDYDVAVTPEHVQAYYSGFLAQRKASNCDDCIKSMQSETSSGTRDRLIDSRNRGSLAYPSQNLFDLLSFLELAILETIGIRGFNSILLHEVIARIDAVPFLPMVGCKKHCKKQTSAVIEYI